MKTATPLESAERIHADHTTVKHLGHWTGATVTLLVPEDVAVEQWDLAWTGRGRVKDAQAPAVAGRALRLAGAAERGEVRILRGGSAQLAAMCSRAYLDDLRRAHRAGTFPTVDDPTRERVN